MKVGVSNYVGLVESMDAASKSRLRSCLYCIRVAGPDVPCASMNLADVGVWNHKAVCTEKALAIKSLTKSHSQQ
jgi:hypothetical protein